MGKMTVTESVFPIYPETEYDEVGCGFLVGNLFVTAGHVIKDGKHPFVILDGIKTFLTNPIYHSFEEGNDEVADLAIYKLDNISSNICFSSLTVRLGMDLISHSYHFSDPRIATPISCNAIVSAVDGMYFGAETTTKLWGGSSGSPVYYKGEVIGMLVAGNDGENKMRPLNFCVFLSATTIMSIINALR